MATDSINSEQQGFDRRYGYSRPTRTAKLRGEIAEMAFLLKASRLGLCVSKPYGDSYAYDFVVDSGTRLWRVQVKSTQRTHGRGYGLTVFHFDSGVKPHYTPEEIDMLVGYVVPADTWYVLPLAAFLPRCHIHLYPNGCRRGAGLFEEYREAWHLLT
jgi:hypothetical protein